MEIYEDSWLTSLLLGLTSHVEQALRSAVSPRTRDCTTMVDVRHDNFQKGVMALRGDIVLGYLLGHSSDLIVNYAF